MTAIITLVAVALLLFFFEIFVPGGILGVLGLIATIAACTLAYQEYQLFGALLTFLIILVGAVVIFLIMMKVLPKSRLTRGLFLSARHTATSNVPLADDRIVGQRGEAITEMAPTGIVLVNGRKVEAASQSGLLEKGTPVEVVAQDSFRLLVRKV